MALCALALCAAAAGARAEVPIPRIAPPDRTVVPAMLPLPTTMGPQVPVAVAIRREVQFDVDKALPDFYAARDHKPVWRSTAAVAALHGRLADAAFDGLDPAVYKVPARPRGGGAIERARWDVSVTEVALAYARDAYGGRVLPGDVSPMVTIKRPELDAADFLRTLERDPAAALEDVHPQHPQFQGLRAALRQRLTRDVEAPKPIGHGANLTLRSTGSRVALLRERLDVPAEPDGGPVEFDAALADAVKVFQRDNRLSADGIVGPRTVRALDAGLDGDDVAAILSNMERWRWLPRDLGARHVMVNVPAFRVAVVENGSRTYEGRVIVGAVGNPTPIFADAIEHLEVNPYWNVPHSIASTEMLDGIRANPRGYMARRGYEVVSRGRVVDPASISWTEANLRRVRIRQKPGRGNALGSVKFMFPNKHAVYLHDTPTKHLFRRTRRAFSHGCVRVQNPFEFADALLRGEPDFDGPGLVRHVGGRHRVIKLTQTIPVFLTYFTLEVGPGGRLIRHDDLYGFDRQTQRRLGV